MIEELTKPLSINEIDFRIQSVSSFGWATILAYKDARVDMTRLDEAVTPLGWKREHLNNNANCIVSIWNEKTKQWISKEDTGTESRSEAQKGLASDSFKRACFNWGIGRELYDYPLIQIKLNGEGEGLKENKKTDEWVAKGRNGKPQTLWALRLKEWVWYSEFKDKKLSFLAAKDANGIIRFKFGEMKENIKQKKYEQNKQPQEQAA